MGRMLSAILRESSGLGSDRGLTLMYECPGCGGPHMVEIEKPNRWGSKWSWNGDVHAPTFHPSVNVASGNPALQCHHFVVDGKINFCGDCHHDLKGAQEVLIPPWNSNMGSGN